MTSPPPAKKQKKDATTSPQVLSPKVAKDKEFLCPICQDIIKEAYITLCGHSFCYYCIVESLKVSNKCPQCFSIVSQEKIIPNFQLNILLSHYKKNEYPFVERKQTVRQLVEFVKDKKYDLGEITDLLHELDNLKEKQKKEEEEMEAEVFLEFLRKTKEEREIVLKRIERDLRYLDDDISRLGSFQHHLQSSLDLHAGDQNNNSVNNNNGYNEGELSNGNNNNNRIHGMNNNNNGHSHNFSGEEDEERRSGSSDEESAMKIDLGDRPSKNRSQLLQLKKRKLNECLPSLQSLYFHIKSKSDRPSSSSPPTSSSISPTNSHSELECFAKSLAKFTMYNKCKKLTTVRFAEPFSSSTIVSSLEFDRDEEFFATAGVNKILRVYEYKNISKSDDISFPRREMPCRSKISALSWNPYLKSYIASTDYEGRVSIWDTEEGKKIISLEEHNKRAWSVDFSHTNPTILASGSDDMTVKIWCLSQLKSTTTIQGTANVCSVAFNPYIANEIALGLADHDIKYYDLRNLSKPLRIFSGHKKSVSYVKFLNKSEIVSASTDSTLKLWSLTSGDTKCTRTFMGHINEKNFVGLSCNNDYIACGSENNSMYIYYKEISHPAVVHRFSRVEDPNKCFISSICWRKRDNVLLSANSEGGIKIFGVE